MKKNILYLISVLAMAIIFTGCGGDDSNSTGTISMNITDAKPVLPDGVEQVLIEFNEVSVHKSGGGWTSLPLPSNHPSFTIDLLQFNENKTTQLVPPVQLESGKYTQVRIGVTNATIVINGSKQPLEIPSENLKTDKNFEFDVVGGGAVDLTVDFDLSQSIVVTGTGTYQLKPVLHIVQTQEAAAIQGTINFGSSTQATVIVTWDKNGNKSFETPILSDPTTDEEYTELRVLSTDPTPFKVFWLVPDEGYFIQILLGDPQNPDRDTGRIYVAPANLSRGAVYNLGNSI